MIQALPDRLAAPPRGFSLVEMMVVMMMATVVTLGIVVFYLSAQATWTDASSQALAQRDATSIVEALSARAHEAGRADVAPVGPGDPNSIVTFYPKGSSTETIHFYWSATDSLVHSGDAGTYDSGPLTPTQVERFSLSTVDSLGLVLLDSLRVRSANRQTVTLSSTFGLYNRVVATP